VPLRAFQILSARAGPHRLEEAGPTGLTPLVGRVQEIGLILERWEPTRDGQGRAWFCWARATCSCIILPTGLPGRCAWPAKNS
jgi:hypothetical protein